MDIKITDLVDEKAIEQVKELMKQIKELKDAYVVLTEKMASKIDVKINGYQELSGQIKDVNDLISKRAEIERKIAESEDELKKKILESVKNEEAVKREKLKTQQEEQRLSNLRNRQRKEETLSIQQAIELSKKQVTSIKEATEANKKLRQAVKEITEAEDKDGKIRERLNNIIQKNTEYIRQNSDAYTKQKMNIGNYTQSIVEAGKQLKAVFKDIRENGITLSNTGSLFKGIGASISSSLSSPLKALLKLSGIAVAFKGIQSLFSSISNGANTIIEFEAANSKLAAILGKNKTEIGELTENAKELGRTTSFTASQVTELQVELAKLGFTQTEILQSTEGILKFAKAVGTDLASAASVAGAAIRMFGASTEETDKYVATMAVATTKSALSFSDLQSSLATVGPVASAFGFTIEDTVTLLGKLKDSGFDASSAATATRNILLNLADTNGKLAKKIGGSVHTMQELQDALIKLNKEDKGLAESLDLTDKRSVSAFRSFMQQADGLVTLRDSVTDVEGELDKMADTMGDNVSGSMARLSSAWEGLVLAFSDSSGIMKSVLDFFTDLLTMVSELLTSADKLIEKAGTGGKATGAKQGKATAEQVLSDFKKRADDYILINNITGDEVEKVYEDFTNQAIQHLEYLSTRAKEEFETVEKAASDFVQYMNGETWYSKIFEGKGLLDLANDRSQLERWKFQQRDAATKLGRDEAALKYAQENEYDMATGKFKTDAKTTPTGNYVSDKEQKQKEREQKEKERAAKAAAKHELQIKEELEKAKIELENESLEKQIMQISLNYNKRMAKITGNSRSEQELRITLGLAMQKAISKKTEEWNNKQELEVLELRKAAIYENDEELSRIELEILEKKYNHQVVLAEGNQEKINLLTAKYETEKQKIIEKFADKRIAKIQQEYATSSILLSQSMMVEVEAIQEAFVKRKITEEEMNKQIEDIKLSYARDAAIDAIELINEQLTVEELSAKKREELERKLMEAKMKLREIDTNAAIKATKDQMTAEQKRFETIAKSIEYANQALSGISSFADQIYQSNIDKLSEQSEKLDEAYDKEIARIERLEENGSISTEEAEARKRAAKDRTEKEEEKLAKKKEELEKKQARLAKATAIAEATMGIAQSIINVWADKGNGNFLSRSIMSGIVGALGAIQLATIVATPLAAYAKGTDDHPGGPAIVGDGGRPELIFADGRLYITPSVPTMVDLPRHAKVLPDANSYEAMRMMYKNDIMPLGSTGDVKVINDYRKLEDKMDKNIMAINGMSKQLHKDIVSSSLNAYVNSKMK